MVSGHAKHANVVFTPGTREAFDADLADSPLARAPSSSRTAGPCRATCCAR